MYELVNGSKNNPTLEILFQISKVINVNVKNFFYATNEFDDVQKEMNSIIEKEGINNKEVSYLSKILDKLFVLKLKDEQ